MESMVGRTVFQYQFVEKLGAGGMGEIYKAQDTRLNRIVAIKVLPSAKSGDPDRRRRFVQEAQAASGLNHPSIITIHDIVSEGDTEFMVMEYVAGKTLNDLIPKGGLRVPQALRYALQIADALNVAHSAGIVHRDLKPANVMVTENGLVKILDFGLAKMTDRSPASQLGGLGDNTATLAAESPLTVEGSILGTVSYMSPEQAQGKRVDTRSDIFSFGVVLYEMLTGRRAFEGDSSLSTLSAILRDDPRPMSEVAPDVPRQMEMLIQRCLRKLPDERWQSMREVQMALSALKHESDSGSLYSSRLTMASGIIPPPLPRPSSIAVPPPLPTPSSSLPPPSAPPSGPSMVAPPPPAPGERPRKRRSGLVLVIVILAIVSGMVSRFAKLVNREVKNRENVTQTSSAPPAAAADVPDTPAPKKEALDNEDIEAMVLAKVSNEVILSQIRSSKTNFDLSTDGVIGLSKVGVPASIIDAMRNPQAIPATPPKTASTPAPSRTPAPASNGKSTPAPQVANANPPAATPSPAPVASNSAPVPAPAAAPPPPAAPAVPNVGAPTVAVTVPEGLPFRILLAADIPADAKEGQQVLFTAAEDFRVAGVVVVPKGAHVIGQITETEKKKFLGIGANKLSFRLLTADAANGAKIKVRATNVPRPDGPPQRPVETNGAAKPTSKDIAAVSGALYIAYIDGAQTLSVPK